MSRRNVLLLMVVLTIAVRLFVIARTYCISDDGATFMEMGWIMSEGKWPTLGEWGHQYAQHPLFPMTLAAVRKAVGGSVLAAQLWGVVLAAMLVIFLFALCEDVFGTTAAAAASFLLAVHPQLADYPALVTSESLYLLFYVLGVWLGYRALSRGGMKYYVGCGLSCGAAYLTRPEGLGVALVMVGWGALLIVSRKAPVKKMAAGLAATCLATALLAAPYVLVLKRDMGQWRLTPKKKVSDIVILTENNPRDYWEPRAKMPPVKLVPYYIKRVAQLGREYTEALHFTTPFFILGLFLRRKVRWRGFGEAFVGSVLFLNVFLCFALIVVFSYLTVRHLATATVMAMPWAGVGMIELVAWARGGARARKLAIAAAVVVIGLGFYKLGDRRGENRAGLREAGVWIKANFGPNREICGFLLRRIAAHAESTYSELQNYWFCRGGKLQPKDYESLIQCIHGLHGDVFVINVFDIDNWSAPVKLPHSIRPEHLKLVAAFAEELGSSHKNILVYQVVKEKDEEK